MDVLELDYLFDLILVDLHYVLVLLLLFQLGLFQRGLFDLGFVDLRDSSGCCRRRLAALGLRRVQELEPVEKLGVFLQGAPVLMEADRLIVIDVDLLEDLVDLLTVDPDMAID